MIYFDLFLGFIRVGLFAFGGAYGAIPMIRDIVLSYGWLTDEQLSYMIAVSESTPGPIMLNLATFVGKSQGGLLGALIATFSVIIPSFIIILLIAQGLKSFIKNKYFQAVLKGMKPCVVGIVLSTGIYMIISNLISVSGNNTFNFNNLLITIILFSILFGTKYLFKKKMSPILLIVISGCLGIILL